jgi:hypothetical protein
MPEKQQPVDRPLSEMSAAEASEHVQRAPVSELAALEQAESSGADRISVRHAIDRRRADLQSGATTPDAPAEPTFTAADMAAEYGSSGERALVYGAYASAGVTELPLDQARALIEEYGSREVPVKVVG